MNMTNDFNEGYRSDFLTPIQIWRDFDPVKDPLDVSIVSSESDGQFIKRVLFFTALSDEDGEVRACVKMVLPVAQKNKQKFVLFLPEIDSNSDYEPNMREMASRDYTVAMVDLYGEGVDSTRYMGAYDYGRVEAARGKFHNATPNAFASPVFLYARILRRFLTLVEAHFPKAKPICFAERSGNELLWQLVAMDNRIYGGMSVLGSGFSYYLGFHREEDPNDDNFHKWEMALSPQAYVKFVACPVLLVTAANNKSSEFDRLDSVVKLLPEQSLCSTIVANRLSNQITETVYNSMWRWVEGRYSARKEIPKRPDISYSVKDGNLTFNVDPDESEKKAQLVSLYYSYDEPNPEYRNWHCIAGKNEDDYLFQIEVCERDRVVYAYANALYRDGVEIASTPIMVDLDRLALTRKRLRPIRLLYDTEMENCFVAETFKDVVLKDDVLQLGKSASGIPGIGVKEGVLVGYNVGETRRLDTDGKLQISAYSLAKKEITVRLTVDRDGYKTYSAKHKLESNVNWQKLIFGPNDFRDKANKSMETWDDMKKIEIIDAEGVLFNNMLWI